MVAVLTDTHVGERVSLSQMSGLNDYDLGIFSRRLSGWTQQVLNLAVYRRNICDVNELIVPMLGDMISGDIHEELSRSNIDNCMMQMLSAAHVIAQALMFLAPHFAHISVPCVVGNHGRRTRKPRAKLRARDNFDWFVAHQLQSLLKDDKRVTFQIPEGTDALVEVHGTRYLLTHGDQARGGGGIGGIWPPLLRMRAKKLQNYEAMGTPFDIMVVGHWHTLIQAASNGLIVNGSLKGFEEFSQTMNFAFEPPQQALWVTVPKNGVVWQAPVLVGNRRTEGW